jgi:beta-mannosidase
MRFSLGGDDWTFKGFVGEDWRLRNAQLPDSKDVRGYWPASVPGSVMDDLWRAGRIPDPYYEGNSLLSEWVPQRSWLFKKVFRPPEEAAASLRGERVRLCFAGVDYEAEFWLNGECLGRHRGMFTPASFEVGDKLRYGEDNLLAVAIEPAPAEQAQIGRSSSVRTHKSRMGYWWDFCPRLVHQGIWDAVYLEATGPARIEDLWVRPEVAPDMQSASAMVTVELSSTRALQVEVETTVRFEGGVVAQARSRQALNEGANVVSTSLDIASPCLWWPNGSDPADTMAPGYAGRPLYQAECVVSLCEADNLSESDRGSQSFGLRRIEFAPNEGAPADALPYTFLVNGQKVYAKGWNWVPIDALYGVPRLEKLGRLLELARSAHVNLLRVWGGGLIESEAFYDLCDRYRIMIWQEFIQSSSGIDNYPPETPEYAAMLLDEAEQIIPRRRNHPSLALWCGGNELMHWDGTPAGDDVPLLAALRDTVRRLDPGRGWLPTSSSGPVFGNTLENIAHYPDGLHDVHGPWEYQGLTEQYTLYNQGCSLFHSEFGVEGFANLSTIEAHIAPEHRWPATLENPVYLHSGSWWVKPATLQAVFGELPDLAATVRAGQFLQFEGLRYALEADRRRQYHNSGTMPWQFNEPFPNAACTSAVDYHARPKPVYYAVARAYDRLSLSARYPTLAWAGRETFEAEVWLANSGSTGNRGARLRMRVLGADGKVYESREGDVSYGPNGAARLAQFECPLPGPAEGIFFFDLALQSSDGELLAGNCYLFTTAASFAPLLALPATSLAVESTMRDDVWHVTLLNIGRYAAVGAWLEHDRPVDAAGGVFFNDNYLMLLPGEGQTLEVEWLKVPETERQLQLSGWNIPTIKLS